MSREAILALGAAIAWIVVTYAGLLWRARVVRMRSERIAAALRSAVESLGGAFVTEECFRRHGRVFRISIGAGALLRPVPALRLSLFTPHVFEYTIRRARHVPPPSERLGADPFYAQCAIDGWVHPELEEYLAHPAVRETTERLLDGRWTTVGRRFVEIFISGNRFDPAGYSPAELARDLEWLERLDGVPLVRRPRGGTLTVRHGFEPHPWPWHWRSEERLLLPKETARFCFSYWDGGPWLHPVVLDVLLGLARGDRVFFLTDEDECPEVACAFGGGFQIADHLFEFDSVAVAWAADLVTQGRIARAIVCAPVEFVPNLRRAFAKTGRHDFHPLSIGLLPRLTYYVRRLRDDEDSWFSGEFEVLSTRRSGPEMERVARATAARIGAEVRVLDRPFLPKLLKDDRLEMTA